MTKLCEYGCGQEAKYHLKFKSCYKWCCSKHYSACPSNIKCWNKGLNKDIDVRVAKYSKTRIGTKPWNKGLTKKTSSKVLEISKLISIAHSELLSNKKRTIKIKSNVKKCNLFVSLKNRKQSPITIKNRIKAKLGMKYDKLTLIKKKYPLFCEIENPKEDKHKNIIIKCKKCNKKFR